MELFALHGRCKARTKGMQQLGVENSHPRAAFFPPPRRIAPCFFRQMNRSGIFQIAFEHDRYGRKVQSSVKQEPGGVRDTDRWIHESRLQIDHPDFFCGRGDSPPVGIDNCRPRGAWYLHRAAVAPGQGQEQGRGQEQGQEQEQGQDRPVPPPPPPPPPVACSRTPHVLSNGSSSSGNSGGGGGGDSSGSRSPLVPQSLVDHGQEGGSHGSGNNTAEVAAAAAAAAAAVAAVESRVDATLSLQRQPDATGLPDS